MKIKVWIPLLTIGLVLTGCGHNQKNDNQMQSNTQSSKKTSSSKTNQAQSKGDKVTSLGLETDNATRLKLINQYLKQDFQVKYGANKFEISGQQYLNITTTKTNNKKQVSYYVSKQPAKINDAKIAQLKPRFTYSETNYGSTKAAMAQMIWLAPAEGLPKIELGHKITGSMEGAAGSSYLTWLEGKWSITIQTSNQINGQSDKAVALAKKMVDFFEDAALPAPSDQGTIKINLNPSATSINVSWNEGPKLYRLEGQDIFEILNFGTSLQ